MTLAHPNPDVKLPPVVVNEKLTIRSYTTQDLQRGLTADIPNSNNDDNDNRNISTPNTPALLDVVVRGYDMPRFKYGVITGPRYSSVAEFSEDFDHGGILTVIYENNKPVGTAGFRFYEDDATHADPDNRRYCELKCLTVDPDHISKGFGTILVENAHILAKVLGYQVMVAVVIADHELDAFYLRRGYTYESEWLCAMGSSKEDNGIDNFFCSRDFILRKYIFEL